VLAPLPATAAPSPAQIEAQINQAWNKLEPLIEQYNGVHAQLQATQAKIDTLEKQIAPLQLRVQMAMTQVGALSEQLYKLGPAYRMSTLMLAGRPQTFVSQLSTLNQMAHNQQAQVAAVAALRDQYQRQEQPLTDLRTKLAAQDAQLAAQKKIIQSQLDDLQKLRLAAYGSTGGSTGNLRPVPCPQQYFGDPGSIAAKKACTLIGKPYIWGEAGPNGYDCSGLTLTAWKAAGVTLGHYTKWQWTEGKVVTRSQLRPGDLVFYYSDLHHMGIYVGNNWIVHAPHTGDFVRMAPMDRGMPIAGYRRPS
jgi:cell wall-associated NlpC family hydrolase